LKISTKIQLPPEDLDEILTKFPELVRLINRYLDRTLFFDFLDLQRRLVDSILFRHENEEKEESKRKEPLFENYRWDIIFDTKPLPDLFDEFSDTPIDFVFEDSYESAFYQSSFHYEYWHNSDFQNREL